MRGFRHASALSLLRLLFAVLAPGAAAVAAAAETGAAPDLRLGDDVRPTFEAIRLRLDPAQKEYSGAVALDLTVRRPTDRFRFHARGQTLGRLALTRDGKEIALQREADDGAGTGLVLVRTAEPLSPGAYRLEIEFTQAF